MPSATLNSRSKESFTAAVSVSIGAHESDSSLPNSYAVAGSFLVTNSSARGIAPASHWGIAGGCCLKA
jgi:hypothetical protein